MGWDSHWNSIYGEQGYRAKYPDENLIRFLARQYGSIDKRKVKVIDIGCGSGNQSYWMAREGFDVCGVDGSAVAIDMGNQRLKSDGINANLVVGDITNLPFDRGTFDLAVDVCSIQHNCFRDINKAIGEVYRVLKPGGRFFSIMRSSKDYAFRMGNKIESHTMTNISVGDLAGCGVVHFFHIEEIKHLLRYFNSLRFENNSRSINGRDNQICHWVVEACK